MLLLFSNTKSFSSLFAFMILKKSIKNNQTGDFQTSLIGSAPSCVSVLHSDQSDQWDNFGSRNHTPDIRHDRFQGLILSVYCSVDQSQIYWEPIRVPIGICPWIPDLAYPLPDWNVSNLSSGRHGLWNQIIIFGSPSGPELDGSPRWVLASCSCSWSKWNVFPFGHKLDDDSTSSKRSIHKLSAPRKN